MFEDQTAQIQSEIVSIKLQKYLSNQQKDQKIKMLKGSFIGGTDSSFKVVASVANTMIGSAIIVYPILFIKDGILGSSIIMLLIGCVQYMTCRLLVIHNRGQQLNYSQTIRRICGQKLYKLNGIVNVLLLFFVCSAYFLLVVDNFYQVTSAIISAFTNFTPPKSTEVHFGQYSFQYATIICILFTLPMLYSKSIDRLLASFKYTIYCVLAYGIFIFASLIRAIAEGSLHFGEYKLFDPDFSSVGGAFALSFLIHPVAAPILKKNIRQQNNQRDLFLGYCLTAFIYFYVGFIGGLTCANSVNDILLNPKEYGTIFDCFKERQSGEKLAFYIFGKIVQLGILIQNVSVFSILNFLSRNQLLNVLNRDKSDKVVFYGYTTALVIFSGVIAIFCIKVDMIISLDGAIVGFFISYGLPIYMHLACLYRKLSPEEKRAKASLLYSQQVGTSIIQGQSFNDPEQVQKILRCNPHPKSNKCFDYVFYGMLLMIGVALGVFKIQAFFK